MHTSSLCVALLGVSSTHLETNSLQATHHNQQRNHCVVRLLAESSVVVLIIIAFGWCGMWSVGSDTLSSQSERRSTLVGVRILLGL
jgi:hypothetical protein